MFPKKRELEQLLATHDLKTLLKKSRIPSYNEVLRAALAREPTPALDFNVLLIIAADMEITDVLQNAMKIPVFARIITNDNFWKNKFTHDFPYFIEILGPELPFWSRGMALCEKFTSMPWRRYYNIVRYIVRTIMIPTLIEKGSRFYPFIITSTLIPGTTQNILVKVSSREQEIGYIGETTYSLTEYCETFIAPVYFVKKDSTDIIDTYGSLNPNPLRSYINTEKLFTEFSDSDIRMDYEKYEKNIGDRNHQDKYLKIMYIQSNPFKFPKLNRKFQFIRWVLHIVPLENSIWKDVPKFELSAATTEEENADYRVRDSYNRLYYDYQGAALVTGERFFNNVDYAGGFTKNDVIVIGKEMCNHCGGEDAISQCGACNKVSYCGYDCQIWNWVETHANECKH